MTLYFTVYWPYVARLLLLQQNVKLVCRRHFVINHYPRRADCSREGRVFTSVCLCVCSSPRYLKNLAAAAHRSWHRNVPWWDLQIHLWCGQKVRVTGHKTLSALVFALLWELAFLV